jgi:hypothetical protein
MNQLKAGSPGNTLIREGGGISNLIMHGKQSTRNEGSSGIRDLKQKTNVPIPIPGGSLAASK